MDPLQPGAMVDRYEVLSTLGRGAVAVVYLVKHRELGTRHALKALLVPAPWVTERLLREGRAQSRLEHPNVVRVLDVISVRGAPGLVSEWVDGAPLDRVLKRHHPTLDEADHLARGILAGVAAAHAAGIVHRDLKPANVLLDARTDTPIPKITDFGLAKALDPDIDGALATTTGSVLGTPAYMAPEQALDTSRVDARADVFALGVILYELTVGTRPFASRSIGDVVQRGTKDAPPLPETLPVAMRDAVAAALRPDPDQRPPDAGALLAWWVADRPLPGAWSPAALAAARAPDATASVGPAQGPTATYSGSVSQTSDPTWNAGPHLLSIVPAAPAVPRPRDRTVRRVGLAAAGLAAIALAATLLRPGPIVALAPDRVPKVSDDPAVQHEMAEAWRAFLDARFRAACEGVERVRDAEPSQPIPHLLAGLALHECNDLQAGLRAYRAAWEAGAGGGDQPGAELAEWLRFNQESGRTIAGPAGLAYLAEHPEDYLAHLVVLRYCSGAGPEACAAVESTVFGLTAEPPVVAHVVRAQAWLDIGDAGRLLNATNEGLAQAPRNVALLSMQASAALLRVDTATARAALDRLAEIEPEAVPMPTLARIAVLDGDAAALEACVAAVSAPGAHPWRRAQVHEAVAQTLLGLGRVEEGLAHAARWREAEHEQGEALSELQSLAFEMSAQTLAGRPTESARLMQAQLDLAARSPQLPGSARNRLSSSAVVLEAIEAARVNGRGPLEAALTQLRLSEYEAIGSIQAIERELAVLDEDVDALEATEPTAVTACDRGVIRADALLRAGAPERAAARYREIVASGCSLYNADRRHLASAHLHLARLLAPTQPDVARAHLAEWRRIWPNPDPDLPAVREAAELAKVL